MWMTVLIWLVVAVAVVWSMFWKGLALWRAGRRGDKIWFLVLLLLNTLGILDIIYLFFWETGWLSKLTQRKK